MNTIENKIIGFSYKLFIAFITKGAMIRPIYAPPSMMATDIGLTYTSSNSLSNMMKKQNTYPEDILAIAAKTVCNI